MLKLDTIVEVLKEGPSTAIEISLETGMKDTYVRNCISKLKKSGKIKEFGAFGTSRIWEWVQ